MALQQRFFSIRQESSVAKHSEQFELLYLQLESEPEGISIVVFVNGLEDCVKAELLINPPSSLQVVIEKARRIETKN